MITLYFDGACEPVNPGGTASYGVVIMQGKKILYQSSKLFKPKKGKEKETSNNVAEYSGFTDALHWLRENNLNKKEIQVFGDSMLVINQMFGDWKIRKGFYKPIAILAKEMISQSFPKITGSWIPREKNDIADELSKAELIKQGIEFRIQPKKEK